jgi:mannose-6-phosphate isomerase-like protein (cupin superfamily)
MKPISLRSSYVHLTDDGAASVVEVTPDFWSELMSGDRSELEAGRMIMQFDFSENWTSWEMHPSGDEIGILLSGDVEVVLERESGSDAVHLTRAGDTVRIPRGVWHTARVNAPASMVFVTPGAGTQHRHVE